MRGERTYVLELGHRKSLKRDRCGGKAAHLSLLIRRGLPVPPGFVLTADLFRHLFETSRLSLPNRESPDYEQQLHKIRRSILDWRFPPRTENRLFGIFKELGSRVAVRSSLVGEDEPHASHAGQMDSFLNIDGPEKMLRSVKKSWASLFTPHAWTYRCRAIAPGSRETIPGMGVIIQKMIEPRAAGVAFSTDPISGRLNILIEAEPEPRGAPTDGRSPDRYLLTPALKLKSIRSPENRKPALSREEILELAGLVRNIVQREASPQDIEWGRTSDAWFILQTRPVTAISRQPVYSRRLTSDMAPGLIKPLVWSTKTLSMAQNVIGEILTRITGRRNIDFSFLVKPLHSRLYTDISRLGGLLQAAGLPSNFFEMMARDDKPSQRFRFRLSMGPPLLRLALFLLRNTRISGRTADFIHRQDRELQKLESREWRDEPDDVLSETEGRVLDLHSRAQWFVFLVTMNFSLRRKIFEKSVKNRLSRSEFDTLLRPSSTSRAFAPRRALLRMAAELDDFAEGRIEFMKNKTDADIRRYLSGSDPGRRLIRRMDAYLDRFGFLSPDGSDFTLPTWRDNPDALWNFLIREKNRPNSGAATGVRPDERLRNKLVRRIPAWKRPLIRGLLFSTLTYQELRERTSLILSRESALMRELFLSQGARLIDKNALEKAEDIFYLHYPEIRSVRNGDISPDRARRLIRERRDRIRRDALIDPPEIIDPRRESETEEPAPRPGCLTGIPGSAGFTRGFARIVRDPSGILWRPTRDDILVVPFTDVGWIPLLHGMGGIVAESGGQLSHTSIIAREYGIPAVVGVPGALSLIGEGQPITVDGTGGRIYLHDSPIKEKTP